MAHGSFEKMVTMDFKLSWKELLMAVSNPNWISAVLYGKWS